jgi:hypothetical protein
MADYQMNAVNLAELPVVPVAQEDHEINEVNSTVEQTNQGNTDPLRFANPLPESESEEEKQDQSPVVDDIDEEEDEEEDIEEPVAQAVEAVEAVQAQPHYLFFVMMNLQYWGIQGLLWIQVLWNALSYASEKTIVLSKSVLRAVQPKLYVFFEGSSYPYRLQDYTLAGPGIAPVEWFYNADTKVFVDSRIYNSSLEYPTQHFEWLSGEIKYNNLVLHDISDFLQEIRWAGTQKPSCSRVLAAWSLSSGIVLNPKEGLSLHTINQDGSESALQVNA